MKMLSSNWNSLKFVPKGPINNIPALVQIMAWRRSGEKPLFEPMMVNLLTHICVTRPQWVNVMFPMWTGYVVIWSYHAPWWATSSVLVNDVFLCTCMSQSWRVVPFTVTISYVVWDHTIYKAHSSITLFSQSFNVTNTLVIFILSHANLIAEQRRHLSRIDVMKMS